MFIQEECLWALFFFYGWRTMKIGGFQKLSLLNYPGKTASTIFTSGCNFHCPYCHNGGLAEGKEPETDPELVLDHLRKRKGMLDGVCISGGEPLLQTDLPQFLMQVRQLGYRIKLDTNGSRPELLEELIRKGLIDYVALDIKNTPEKYAVTAGCATVSAAIIEKSAEILRKGNIPYEFRTTVVEEFHTEADIEIIARKLAGGCIWYLQPFRDAPEVLTKGLHTPDPQQMEKFGSAANRYIKTIIRN